MKNDDKRYNNDKADPVEQLYVPTGKAVCIIFAITCAAFVPINLRAGNLMMVCANGLISFFMLAGYLSILKSGTLKYAVPLIALVLVMVTIQYLVTGGEEGFSVLWILLIPPFAIYILDVKKAVAVSLVIWLIVMAGLWTPLNDFCYDYTKTFEIRFPILYAVEIVLAILIKNKISQIERRRDELLQLNIQYKEDAQKANRAKSSFLASMSHEIRTPINVVLGMNEMILRESTEENILEYASNVDTSGKFLLSLVNDILDISKIESGKIELVSSDYLLSTLLNDVLQLVNSRAEAKGVRIIVEVGSDTPEELQGDSMKIGQVLTNILTNAVKYTRAGGTATMIVSAQSRSEDSVYLNMGVRDTGRGIRKEDMPKLFEAFTRVDEKVNATIEGTGLGLAISRSYIQRMGGDLSAESEYGKGSYFHFTIPQRIRSHKMIGKFAQNYGNIPVGKDDIRQSFTAPSAKVLVVDDDSMNRAVMRGLLKRTLIQGDFVDSGAACLGKISQSQYDIIFLDHMMPGMDGIETLAEIKQKYPDNSAKIIALTANAIVGAKEMYLESGFDDYMTKPVNGNILEKILMEYIPEEKLDIIQETDRKNQAFLKETKKDAGMQDTGNDSGGISVAKLREWKEAVPELDVLLGLEYSIGDGAFYREMLRTFSGQSKIFALNQAYADGDWKRYHNLVHALKSAALSIGFVRLSEKAAQLEYAVNRGDYEYIGICHEEAMRVYEECMDGIREGLKGLKGI